MFGSPGPDIMHGRGGQDEMSGEAGSDKMNFYGGPGDDDLDAGWRDGRRDILRCGEGVDTATYGANDKAYGCERRF
jgi:hypothetical protein